MSTLPTRDDQGSQAPAAPTSGALPHQRTPSRGKTSARTPHRAVRWAVYAVAGVIVAAVGAAGVVRLGDQGETATAPAAVDSNLALKDSPLTLPPTVAGLSPLASGDVTSDPAWLQQAKKATGGAVFTARTYGRPAPGRILRVVAARTDLTGALELGWAAGSETKIGATSCTNTTRFTPDQAPRARPTLMLCWRTSGSLSVYALEIDPRSTTPVASTQAAAAVDAVWRSASIAG